MFQKRGYCQILTSRKKQAQKNAVLYSLVDQIVFIHLQLVLYHQQSNSAISCQLENKIRLQAFLLDKFKDLVEKNQKKKKTFKEKCFFPFSIFNRTDLFCHQEGADTRIFYHVKILN